MDPEDSSGSKANISLIQNLIGEGFEATVVHFTQKQIHLSGAITIAVYEKKWTPLFFMSRLQRLIQRWTSINITWKLERIFGFSPSFFSDVKSLKRALKRLIEEEVPDLVIALSKGASFRPHFAIMNLKEAKGRWLAYIHDPFPYSFYPSPFTWKEPGYQKKEARFLKMINQATFVGFPSKMLLEWMKKFSNGIQNKSVVIPHQLIDKTELNAIESMPDWWSENQFNVLHAGNLLRQRPPHSLVEAFKIFLQNRPKAKKNSHLVFVGPAAYHRKYLMSEKYSTENIIFYDGTFTFSKTKYLQKTAKVNVILESPGEISPFLPGKFPHCVEANRPILLLGPPRSECRRLLGNGYPFWARADDITLITQKLIKLYDLWVGNPEDFSLNRPDLKAYLSSKRLSTTVNELIQKTRK